MVEVIAEAVVAAEEHQEVGVVPHVEVDAAALVPEVAQRPLLYVDLSANARCCFYTYAIFRSPIAMAVSSSLAERRTCW